jgi:D-aminopeptidase
MTDILQQTQIDDLSLTKASDWGISIGQMEKGATNSICDIEGVSVGKVTLSDGAIQTGVTALHVVKDNIFEQKCVAAGHVINGFGKSAGLLQLEELGQLETPIVLTNTLSVGTASEALVRYMLEHNPAIGETTGSVNPLVLECNDGAYLNDIRGLHVKAGDVETALINTHPSCPQGAIGAGTGMSCYGLKGGIGSSSRRFKIGGNSYHLGALTLCNMGLLDDLLVDGRKVGREIAELKKQKAEQSAELGSIIMLLVTDAPLSSRQLKRISRRAGAGLARTGTQFGSGSGDIVVGVSTANRIPHYSPESGHQNCQTLHEDKLDILFRAAIESTEEAIINCLFASKTTSGKHDRVRHSLADYWPKLDQPKA